MNKTKIEWVRNPDGTQGYTWNPATGCLHGCSYCYAAKMAKRFKQSFKPTFHEERLSGPFKLKEPSTIFVGSMCDLFGEWVPDEWIERVFDVVIQLPQHQWIFLTKNPARYEDYKNKKIGGNVYFGATITNPDFYYPDYYNIDFVSFEPLLGFDAEKYQELFVILPDFDIKQVIVGALNKNGKPSATVLKEDIKLMMDWLQELEIPMFCKDSVIKLWPDEQWPRELVWK